MPEKANITFVDGHPKSILHDDGYYSRGDGLAESRHVFLKEGGVTDLWQHQKQMIIAETGFGTGLNFLMLWQAWEEAQCPCSIRFYSFEKFPLDLETAKTCHRAWQNDLGPWIHQLENEWPNQQKEGWQSINFCDGKLLLNIYHGDISDGLKHWPPQTQPDIWFLDGFSPAKNRDLWSDELFDHMAKTAKKGTRMSTFTAAGFVRRGLKERGYQMEKVKGYGTKREMLKGFFSSNDKS